MDTSQIFILVAITALVILAVLIFFLGKKRSSNRLTPIAGLAFAFFIAGLFFGEKRFIGYSLFGAGMILAVVDIILRSKSK